jgi:hypothetical protein
VEKIIPVFEEILAEAPRPFVILKSVAGEEAEARGRKSEIGGKTAECGVTERGVVTIAGARWPVAAAGRVIAGARSIGVTVVPRASLDDVAQRTGPVCWIGQCLGQLTARTNVAARLGFAFEEYDDTAGYTNVTYRATHFPKSEPEINRITCQKAGCARASTGPASSAAMVIG